MSISPRYGDEPLNQEPLTHRPVPYDPCALPKIDPVNAKPLHETPISIKRGLLAMAKLVGRAAALLTAPVTIPILYLSMVGATAIGKAIGMESSNVPAGEGNFSKAKENFYKGTFLGDVKTIGYGIKEMATDASKDAADAISLFKVIGKAITSIAKPKSMEEIELLPVEKRPSTLRERTVSTTPPVVAEKTAAVGQAIAPTRSVTAILNDIVNEWDLFEGNLSDTEVDIQKKFNNILQIDDDAQKIGQIALIYQDHDFISYLNNAAAFAIRYTPGQETFTPAYQAAKHLMHIKELSKHNPTACSVALNKISKQAESINTFLKGQITTALDILKDETKKLRLDGNGRIIAKDQTVRGQAGISEASRDAVDRLLRLAELYYSMPGFDHDVHFFETRLNNNDWFKAVLENNRGLKQRYEYLVASKLKKGSNE
jgi:hypothetical protein